MTNFKKNIGFLWPCDGLNEQEYWKFLPKDVRWLTARYGAETETEELTERNLEQYASLKVLKGLSQNFEKGSKFISHYTVTWSGLRRPRR